MDSAVSFQSSLSTALASVVLLVGAAVAAPTVPLANSAMVDSYGVNTHFMLANIPGSQWRDGPYSVANYNATLKKILVDLGVSHIRDGYDYKDTEQGYQIRDLAKVGIKACIIVDVKNADGRLNTRAEDLLFAVNQVNDWFRSGPTPAMEAMEGPNEYDGIVQTYQNEPWQSTLQLYMQTLNQQATALWGNARGFPIIAPSVSYASQRGNQWSLQGWVDKNNMHSYANGSYPGFDGMLLDQNYNFAKLVSNNPMWVTETGYSLQNASNPAQGAPVGIQPFPLPPDHAARYISRIVPEYHFRNRNDARFFNQPIERTYLYELVDGFYNATDGEASFGLVDKNLVPRKSYYVLKDMLSLMKDTSTGTVQPTALDYTLSVGATLDENGKPLSEYVATSDQIHHLLLQKKNGVYQLLLWWETKTYDWTWDSAQNKGVGVVLPPSRSHVSVSVNLSGVGAKAWRVNNPYQGTSWGSRVNSTSFTLDVYPEAQIIEIADSPTLFTSATCSLDVDGDGSVSAATDGLIILRYLAGFRGSNLTRGINTTSTPARTDTSLENYLSGLNLDLDGNVANRATTDGTLLIRALLGLPAVNLTNGTVANPAVAPSGEAIYDLIRTRFGTSCVALKIGT